MTLKLDMSKAYDRVEWTFVKHVVERLGFVEGWVQQIMTCLSSVKYLFKWNNQITGSVVPSRGLRQGDPISLYLFLLCAEAFSTLLVKATKENFVTGVLVCREHRDFPVGFSQMMVSYPLERQLRNAQRLLRSLVLMNELRGKRSILINLR
ncbi:uncharacterized protein LOC110739567 [Chenopodium quinoa]|uniref:uncharacterized protein LOC110739567 n=1 Tax=Chenopodium quinoa TaxID=63459 RepID=UPI000B79A650|nr:uncharacterized protein LOC110739567 [Chenopodium quinoa]